MRRTALFLVLAALVFTAGIAAAGCGGGDEASPTPDTFTDTTETTETDTTETTTETETTPPGDAAAGKEIFVAQCATCHVLADAGSDGTIGPNLDDSQPEFDLVVDRVTNGRGVMPPFSDTLTEQQITDVATYVSEVAGG